MQAAHANRVTVAVQLEAAGKRALPVGRVPAGGPRWRYRANLALIVVLALAVIAVLAFLADWLLHGAWKLAASGTGAMLHALR